jgi:predicted ATPase
VIRGELGIGKTTLLEYLRDRGAATGCSVTRGAGIEAETEMAFAGLQQLCAPILDRLVVLPEPQRDALRQSGAQSASPSSAY